MQWSSVEEWAASRNPSGISNDLMGTSHWSTTNRMPLPPPTAYGAAYEMELGAGGSKVKGFPASHPSMRGSTQAARASFANQIKAQEASMPRPPAMPGPRINTAEGGRREQPPTLRLARQTLQPGGGATATAGDLVSIAYAGFFADPASAGSPPFDQGNDLRFTIGAGEVVDGMEQLVYGMAEGEVARLTIPSHLAYGAKGHPPVIPPNADLMFEVRLNAIAQKEQVVPNPNAPTAAAATTAPPPPPPAPMDEAELQRLRIQKMHEAKLQFAAPLGRTTFRY